MKKIFTLALIYTNLVILPCITYSFPSYAREGSDQWFKQPTQGNLVPRDSRIKEVLYRADRPRTLVRYRYYPEISPREYYDCNAFKYVDCNNYAFCRCWQCRFHQYPYDF